jgi:hypothetical protein
MYIKVTNAIQWPFPAFIIAHTFDMKLLAGAVDADLGHNQPPMFGHGGAQALAVARAGPHLGVSVLQPKPILRGG